MRVARGGSGFVEGAEDSVVVGGAALDLEGVRRVYFVVMRVWWARQRPVAYVW